VVRPGRRNRIDAALSQTTYPRPSSLMSMTMKMGSTALYMEPPKIVPR
jgi:hypothetical protein